MREGSGNLLVSSGTEQAAESRARATIGTTSHRFMDGHLPYLALTDPFRGATHVDCHREIDRPAQCDPVFSCSQRPTTLTWIPLLPSTMNSGETIACTGRMSLPKSVASM